MSMDPDTLARLAQAYAQGMSSIRGRRVVRLIRREFAGASSVACLPLATGGSAVLGVSPAGAALCATDGRGPEVAVIKWRHGAAEGVKTLFSLLKDSLPATAEHAVALASLPPPRVTQPPAGEATPDATLSPWARLAAVEASNQGLPPEASDAYR